MQKLRLMSPAKNGYHSNISCLKAGKCTIYILIQLLLSQNLCQRVRNGKKIKYRNRMTGEKRIEQTKSGTENRKKYVSELSALICTAPASKRAYTCTHTKVTCAYTHTHRSLSQGPFSVYPQFFNVHQYKIIMHCIQRPTFTLHRWEVYQLQFSPNMFYFITGKVGW